MKTVEHHMSEIDNTLTKEAVAALRGEVSSLPYYSTVRKQKLEVHEKREALAKLAEMMVELQSIHQKVEEIQKFCIDNDLDHMVSFCCYDNPEWVLNSMMNADVGYDAMQWASSNHDC
jgi:citrate synthase